MSTLVYHAGALGDFVTILPLISLWRTHHPTESITLLGKPDTGALGIRCGFFDSLIDVTGQECLGLFGGEISSSLEKRLGGFDHAILFCADSSPLTSRLVRCGVKNIYSQEPFPSARIRMIEYRLSLFGKRFRESDVGLPIISSDRLPPSPVGIEERTVALHPGSGSRKKNWPLARYYQLAKRLQEEGYSVAWVIGPAEESMSIPPASVKIQNLTIPALASVLQRCGLSIGNDSGTMHLAAAVGSPCVSLFGPSDPAVWAPLGPKTIVIQSGQHCSPCHLSQRNKECGRGNCMEKIDVEEVLAECLHILQSTDHYVRRSATEAQSHRGQSEEGFNLLEVP